MQPWGVDGDIRGQIRSGAIAYELARPVDLYTFWYCRAIGWKLAAPLMRCVPIFVFAGLVLPLIGSSDWSLRLPPSWASAAGFALTLLGTLLLTAPSPTSTASACSGRSAARASTRSVMAGVLLLSGMIIPLPLFPDWLKPLLYALPFGGLADTPFRVYTGNYSAGLSLLLFAHQAGWTIVLVLLGRWVLAAACGASWCREAESMRNNLRLYLRYLGISIRAQLQYRGAFVMQTIGHMAVTVTEMVGIWALFRRFGNLPDWTLPQVAMFYGLVQVTWSIADALARGFDTFGGTVRSGDFDRMLLRPRSTVLQLAGQEFTLKRIGRFGQGLAVLAWAIAVLPIPWSIAKVGLLLAAVVGGVCLFFGIIVLQATMCFWTVETLEIW